MQKERFIVGDADVTSRSRAINKPGIYGLLPAASRVFSGLPGFQDVRAQVMGAPQLGAKFVEYELFVDAGGKTLAPRCENLEHFFYVLEGGLSFETSGVVHALEPGCFAWLPPQTVFSFVNKTQAQARLVWIRRPYEKVEGIDVPAEIIRHQSEVSADPTDTYLEQHLTPYEDIAFDMGINLQTFDPGVYFSFAESHIMEHGLYMLEGRGIYWLNGDFMEVQQGDFIYMAPFCPQFYYATGWGRSAYLLYKDVNRDYATQL
jgi:(S)-ureidoglycine aminohydrolase